LILAIINWLFVWGKYFLYFYGVLDVASIITDLSGTSLSIGGLGSLTGIITKVVGKFTIMLPASLFVSSILNSAVTFWPLVYFPYSLDHSKLGAFYSVCEAFFYTWWVIGWLPTALGIIDIAIAKPYGSGTFDLWSGLIIFYTAGEWLITAITLTIVYPAFDAWFLRQRIAMAKEVIAEFDSPELQAERKQAEEKNNTDAKKDGFDDQWSVQF
jgi:hypothetical protein